MRTGIVVEITAAERDRLEAIVADRNSPQKHVWRAEIVLATADGPDTVAIMRHIAKSKTVVWLWQGRFAQEGVMGSAVRFCGSGKFLVCIFANSSRPKRVALSKPFGATSGVVFRKPDLFLIQPEFPKCGLH